MAPDFEVALALVARELAARGDVVGLLFFGSAARGTATAGSDVDLYAVTRAEARGHLGRVVDGVPVEVSFGSGAQWRTRLARELPAVVQLWARGPSTLAPEALLARRFHLTEHLRDLDGLPERGPATALAGAECVRSAIALFCAVRRIWLPPARRAVEALAPHDPAFSASVGAAAEAGFSRAAASRVAAAALKPLGGPVTDYDITAGNAGGGTSAAEGGAPVRSG